MLGRKVAIHYKSSDDMFAVEEGSAQSIVAECNCHSRIWPFLPVVGQVYPLLWAARAKDC